MKIYINYSNEEKSDYKLRMYIENLCNTIGVVPNTNVIEPTFNAMNAIRDVHGNKRLKIKDSILIVCIGKILSIEPIILANRIGIDKKYIYNAYKLFASVPELKNLQCVTSPFDYIVKIYNKVDTGDNILEKVELLIFYCEENNILTEHNCATIGTVCLYYIFIDNDYTVDLDKFSTKYHVSSATILKTFKKLSTKIHSLNI